MKVSDTQYHFKDEMMGSHSGQIDMHLSLHVDGSKVGYIDYTIFHGVPEISMIEVYDKGKSYGKALVKKLQSLYPDEEIQWGHTTKEGEALRNSFQYKKVPTEYYNDFIKYKATKKKLDQYQERADELWSKDDISSGEKEELSKIANEMNDLNDIIYDLEDIIDFEKPYKKIIQ